MLLYNSLSIQHCWLQREVMQAVKKKKINDKLLPGLLLHNVNPDIPYILRLLHMRIHA